MTIDAAGLDLLFREARTHNKFTEEPISDETLHELYDILKFGPTSANSSPGRFLFLRTKEAKERLAPALSSGNLAKTMAAPVTVIVAYDPKFHEKLPKLFPHNQDAESWFTSNDALAATTAFRNGTLAGRLSDHSRARAGAGYRSDVRASTTTRWTRNSWPSTAGGRTSWSISGAATGPACSPARPAWISTRPASCCSAKERSEFRQPSRWVPRPRAGHQSAGRPPRPSGERPNSGVFRPR